MPCGLAQPPTLEAPPAISPKPLRRVYASGRGIVKMKSGIPNHAPGFSRRLPSASATLGSAGREKAPLRSASGVGTRTRDLRCGRRPLATLRNDRPPPDGGALDLGSRPRPGQTPPRMPAPTRSPGLLATRRTVSRVARAAEVIINGVVNPILHSLLSIQRAEPSRRQRRLRSITHAPCPRGYGLAGRGFRAAPVSGRHQAPRFLAARPAIA